MRRESPPGRALAFCLVNSAISFSYALWRTLLPLYLELRGLAGWEIGVGVSLSYNMPLLLSFASGYLVDRLSWRVSFPLAQALLAASVLCLTLVDSLPLMLALSIPLGFAMAVITQVGVEVVAEVSGSERRGLAYALFLLATGSSHAVGASISGFIARLWGYGTLFVLASSATALSAVVSALCLGRGDRRIPRPGFDDVIGFVRTDARFRALAVTLLVHDFSVYIAIPYLALYAEHSIGLSEVEIGLLNGLSTAAKLTFQAVSGLVADRIGGSCTLVLHFVGVSASYIALTGAGDFPQAAAVFAAIGAATSLDLPARRLILSRIAPRGYLATVSGLADSMAGLGAATSPILGGLLWDVSHPLPLVVAGLTNLLAIPPVLRLRGMGE